MVNILVGGITLSSTLRVKKSLDNIHAIPTLVPNEGYNIANPKYIRDTYGRLIRYFHLVESDVPDTGLHIAKVTGDDDIFQEFASDWVPQEAAHGEIFAAVAHQSQIPLYPIKHRPTTRIHEFVHEVATHSPQVADLMRSVVAVRGAIHEKTTGIGYNKFDKALREHGESALANSLTKPIRAQESAHLRFYRDYSEYLYERLQPWQQRMLRYVTEKTFRPVGVESDQRRRDFGHVVLCLFPGLTDSNFSEFDSVARLAGTLLHHKDELPTFVTKSIIKCINVETQLAKGG